MELQHLAFVMIGILFALIPLAKSYSTGVRLKVNYFALMLAEAFVYSLLLGGLLQSILRLSGLSSGGPGNGPPPPTPPDTPDTRSTRSKEVF